MWIGRDRFRWDVHHAVSRDFWRWQQLRHSLPRQTYPACLLRVYHHLTDVVGSSPLLCYDLHSIDALGMGCVCHIYTVVHFLQGAARCSRYFSCAKLAWSGFAARARFSYHKNFSEKMARCFIFSKPASGENFLRYPLSSKPNDFMPLIARKNQGSTPMPLLK